MNAPGDPASQPLFLNHNSWTDLPETTSVVVPMGSTEQHGPHLPFTTDAMIAEAASHAIVSRLAPPAPRHEGRGVQGPSGNTWVVAPTLWYGTSGEHQGFPGTASIGSDALQHVLVELTRSLATWATEIVFINGHGSNGQVLAQVIPEMRAEGHNAKWAHCHIPGTDAHAGHTETSLMLHLHPEKVQQDKAEVGNLTSIDELMPQLVASGIRDASENGILGDPTTASAEEGARMFSALVDSLVTLVEQGSPNSTGHLSLDTPALT